jgi:hypothetical protein
MANAATHGSTFARAPLHHLVVNKLTVRRSHSRRASAKAAIAMIPKTTAITHSSDPLC